MRTPTARSDSLRWLLSSLMAGVLAAHGTRAADTNSPLPKALQGTQCRSTLPPDPRLIELRKADPLDQSIDITSDTGDLGREGDANLHGDVTIRMGQRLLTAEEAHLDSEQRSVDLHGKVEYLDPQLHVRGQGGSFQNQGAGEFQGAEFELLQLSVRGAAEDAKLRADGQIDLTGVRYTACPPGNEDWQIKAATISIDQDTSTGTGHNVELEFKGVPILYSPWISFPVGTERKSGLLFPAIGTSSKLGTELTVPWYWNIAPNMDATFTGRLYSARGVGLDPEFRYLTEDSRGILDAEYLFHDKVTGDARSFAEWQHVTRFEPGTRLYIDASNVSDSQYFEDFGSGFEATSIVALSRLAELRQDTEHWSLRARTQEYQIIDLTLSPQDRPYTILPQLTAVGHWRDLPDGFAAAVYGELENFQRDIGPDGVRIDAEPSLEWRADRAGAYLAADAGWRYTQYSLTNVSSGPEAPSRSLPIATVDSGLVLERTAGAAGDRVQTLEPRALYLYVPYRNQNNLPVFDTALPDLNMVQLFRDNRYVGADRLSDADQMSVGLTSRLLDAGRGRQYLSATVGEAFYFSQPRVRLPDEPPAPRSVSNVIAELELAAFQNWNAHVGYQWNPNQNYTEKSDVFVQYRPASDQVVNLGYRFLHDQVEQADISTAWPISHDWRGFARWVYSLRDSKTVDQFVGIEYSSCCWGLRVVARHFLNSHTGSSDTSVGVELELKGLSSVGTNSGAFLRNAIRGYSALPPAPRS